jgi:hypothetical protein
MGRMTATLAEAFAGHEDLPGRVVPGPCTAACWSPPPLARLGLESRRVADRRVFELRITGWSVAGARHLLLAEAEGHGPPVRWWPEGSVIPAAR